MIATVNARFMDEQQRYAEGHPGVGGMMHIVRVTLFPDMRIYRFASAGVPDDRLYGAPWWIGFSPQDTLMRLARVEARSLRDVARQCLAVPPEWGNAMNLLVCASVVQPLAAWSGTPRTARTRERKGPQYGEAWRPDRSITQLYIPGLREIDWTSVLLPVSLQAISD
jgi:hypothetical protein